MHGGAGSAIIDCTPSSPVRTNCVGGARRSHRRGARSCFTVPVSWLISYGFATIAWKP
jgi:hypothetical protein